MFVFIHVSDVLVFLSQLGVGWRQLCTLLRNRRPFTALDVDVVDGSSFWLKTVYCKWVVVVVACACERAWKYVIIYTCVEASTFFFLFLYKGSTSCRMKQPLVPSTFIPSTSFEGSNRTSRQQLETVLLFNSTKKLNCPFFVFLSTANDFWLRYLFPSARWHTAKFRQTPGDERVVLEPWPRCFDARVGIEDWCWGRGSKQGSDIRDHVLEYLTSDIVI